jgi:hypothetical protein
MTALHTLQLRNLKLQKRAAMAMFRWAVAASQELEEVDARHDAGF